MNNKHCEAYNIYGSTCANVATHTTCDPVGGVVCEEHTCRCSKLFASNVNAHVIPLPKPGTVSGPNVLASEILGSSQEDICSLCEEEIDDTMVEIGNKRVCYSCIEYLYNKLS